MRIAVIDSGADRSHPCFAGLSIGEKHFVPGSAGDALGHGTHHLGVLIALLGREKALPDQADSWEARRAERPASNGFMMDKVYCVDESGWDWTGSDEISIGGTSVDETGDVKKISAWEVSGDLAVNYYGGSGKYRVWTYWQFAN